jgi:hypothetical protein
VVIDRISGSFGVLSFGGRLIVGELSKAGLGDRVFWEIGRRTWRGREPAPGRAEGWQQR